MVHSVVGGFGAKPTLLLLDFNAYPGNVRGRRNPLFHGQSIHGGVAGPARGDAGAFEPAHLSYTLGKPMILRLRKDFKTGAGSHLFIKGFPRPGAVLRRSPGTPAAASHADGAGVFGYLEAIPVPGLANGPIWLVFAEIAVQIVH